MVFGLAQFWLMPKQMNPDVALDFISITTSYPNQNPKTIEQNITNKIEDKIKTIKKYKSLRSESNSNQSRIQIELLAGIFKYQ